MGKKQSNPNPPDMVNRPKPPGMIPKKTAPKNHVQEGKPRPSLLPMDILINHVCPAYEEGLIKYERESWRMGFQVSVLFDAAQRHMEAFFYEREDYDPDAAKLGVKKHHLAGSVFCLLAILQTLENYPELDDRINQIHKKSDRIPTGRTIS